MTREEVMEVILLEKVDNVGSIGDLVKVKSGFARNFLIPQGKATLATAENKAKFEARRAELEAKAANELSAARDRAKKLEGQVIRVRAQTGTEGKLFGSVGTVDIAEALDKLGLAVERSEIRLPDGPLRLVGEHQVELHLHADVNVDLKVIVESDEEAPAA
jgi:large subunit ribosomal protein L9